MVKRGEFLEAFPFKRYAIHIPPLRERPEDTFNGRRVLDRYSNIYNKNIKNISDEVKKHLKLFMARQCKELEI